MGGFAPEWCVSLPYARSATVFRVSLSPTPTVPEQPVTNGQTAAARSRGDARSRIFAAAGRLFAEQGFNATSMRMIAAAADVPLASINYHFGSKRELMDAVYRHVFGGPEGATSYLDRLDREAADSGRPLPLERIVDTLIESVCRLARRESLAGPVFRQLIGRACFEPYVDALPQSFVRTMDWYLRALRQALPGLPDEELRCRLHFFIGLIAYLMAGRDVMHLLDRCQPCAGDGEQLLHALAPFVVAGFRAPPGLATCPDLGGVNAC